jgi:dolichol-phosphate mannosyltransferase
MVPTSPQAASGDGASGQGRPGRNAARDTGRDGASRTHGAGSDREGEASAGKSATTERVVCTLPTYNESANILPLARELLDLGPTFHVLVIDDNSPDGTWRIVAEAARSEPRLRLLHRTRDKGRGNAGREGFVEALKMDAAIVVEMDADFSHQPRFVPALIERLERGGASIGLVLGSRAVAGGLDADRGLTRRMITKAANLYIRVLLGVRVRDCNSGFRCWRRETLERIHVEEAFSPGPAIVQELLFKTARAGIGIAEVPIEFANRLHGQSTLTVRTLLSGYTAVLKLRWMSLCGRL